MLKEFKNSFFKNKEIENIFIKFPEYEVEYQILENKGDKIKISNNKIVFWVEKSEILMSEESSKKYLDYRSLKI